MLKFDDGDPAHLVDEEVPHDARYWARHAIAQAQARAYATIFDYVTTPRAAAANVIDLAAQRALRAAPVSPE